MSIAIGQKILDLEAKAKLQGLEISTLREEMKTLAEIVHTFASEKQKTLHVARK